jgi:NAD(P)-dependent dehydrogenase (short-subunit alcohol dehydrogenase family)
MFPKRWSADDVPDQTGRVAVVTGANTGLGLETARVLARRGASVVLAVRDVDRGAAAVESIRGDAPDADLTVQHLDLASLSAVRAAADQLHEDHDRIDLLINNAGVMYTPRDSTEDGIELQFGVNHFGHFALTGLVIDLMTYVEGSRVVTVSSLAHRGITLDLDAPGTEGNYNAAAAYSRSKLANLLFAYQLQDRLAAAGAATQSLAAHPGISSTELVRHAPAVLRTLEVLARPVVQSAAMGALPTLRAATDPGARGGQYYGPDLAEMRGHPRLVRSSGASKDVSKQRRLWELSEQLTGVGFPL